MKTKCTHRTGKLGWMKKTFENKQIKHALAPSSDWEKVKRIKNI